jgi:hypothetical protein
MTHAGKFSGVTRHAPLSQGGSAMETQSKSRERGFRRRILEGKNSPPQPRRGGRDIKKISRSDLLWSGRGGVGQEVEFFLANTTPSALADVALRLFLLRAATPPPLRRGILARHQSVSALTPDAWRSRNE